MTTNIATTVRFASHCAACRRPMTDAVSMERGLGPICSKKYYQAPDREAADLGTIGRALEGTPDYALFAELCAVAGDAREEGNAELAAEMVGRFDVRRMANRLVMSIAIEQDGDFARRYTQALAALGFASLAERITEKLDVKRSARRVVKLAPVAAPVVVEAAPVVEAVVEHVEYEVTEVALATVVEIAPIREAAAESTCEAAFAHFDAAPAPTGIIHVDRDGDILSVSAPYSERFNARRRALGLRFDRETKTHEFEYTPLVRECLWRDLCDCFPGCIVIAGERRVRLPVAKIVAIAA